MHVLNSITFCLIVNNSIFWLFDLEKKKIIFFLEIKFIII